MPWGWAWHGVLLVSSLAGGLCRWQASVYRGRTEAEKLGLKAPEDVQTFLQDLGTWEERVSPKTTWLAMPGMPALICASRCCVPSKVTQTPSAPKSGSLGFTPTPEPRDSPRSPGSPCMLWCLPLPPPRSQQEGVPMAPLPPHTLSSLAAICPKMEQQMP